MKIFLISIVALGTMATTTLAADWPRFRGPDGAGLGTVPNLPLPLSEASRRWCVKLPGTGHSSPVICGTRLFVTCGENATAKRTVLALDAASGSTLWQREFPSKTYQQNKDNSYASATPACDAEGVVVVWTTPEEVLVVALDNAGKEVWRRPRGPFVCNHGSGTSAIIVGDLVVLANDQDDPQAMPEKKNKRGASKVAGKSCLVALDRKTGTTRWQLDRRSSLAAFATPCVRRTAAGAMEIICANTANGLTGVAAATGKIVWGTATGFVQRCVCSPVFGAGLVITTAGSGGAGSECIAVRPGAKAELAYSLPKPLPYVPSPLVFGDKLILWGDNGQVACLRMATGELLWREKVEGTFYSSPIAVNGHVMNVSKTGDVFMLDAGEKFAMPVRFALGEKSFATPAVAGDILYIRTYTQLFAFGGK